MRHVPTKRDGFVKFFPTTLIAFLAISIGNIVHAQPVAPAFSSRPGAAYTLYMNFSGFSFTGNWGGQTPGVTPAYNGQTGASFTAQEQANIKNIWARVSESYAPFNVNVTTVDPAVAAGQAGSDLARQNYYDATARLMHSVIGDGASTFYGTAGGVSFVNVWSTAQTQGRGTNWTFVNRLGGANAFHNIFSATAHEVGHAAGLSHQGDYIGTTLVNEYSRNNNSAVIAPIMGVGYSAVRNTWRQGRISTNVGVIQNDPATILSSNPGMGLYNDGIGRTTATATALALVGNSIDSQNAKGVIVPVSASAPNPIGENNYTRGIYSFTATGLDNIVSITANAGGQLITAGVADPRPMLDATLRILNSSGGIIAESNTVSLSETLNLNLAAGNYFVEVASADGEATSLGPNGDWTGAQLYDMGSYFLSGSIVAVPEPSTVVLLAAGVFAMTLRRRR